MSIEAESYRMETEDHWTQRGCPPTRRTDDLVKATDSLCQWRPLSNSRRPRAIVMMMMMVMRY